MSETPISGEGTKFYRHNGLTYEEIGRVESISGPSLEKTLIDVTCLSSPNGYREFIAGFKNSGTVELTLQYIASTFSQFKSDFEARPGRFKYKIVLDDDDNSVLSFTGIVMSAPLTIPTDDKITFNVSIQITGAVSFSESDSNSIP